MTITEMVLTILTIVLAVGLVGALVKLSEVLWNLTGYYLRRDRKEKTKEKDEMKKVNRSK